MAVLILGGIMERLKTFAFERCANRRQVVLTPCIGIVFGIEYKVRIALVWLYWGFYITLGQKHDAL